MIKELESFFQWVNGVYEDLKKSTEEKREKLLGTQTALPDENPTSSGDTDSFFRKVERLNIFSLYGNVIHTPILSIRQAAPFIFPLVQDMIENESTEFVEGFLAGLFYGGKVTEMGGRLAVEAGTVSPEHTDRIRTVQIDAALIFISDYLVEQRNRN